MLRTIVSLSLVGPGLSLALGSTAGSPLVVVVGRPDGAAVNIATRLGREGSGFAVSAASFGLLGR